LSVEDIASVVSDPSKVIGLHFFNPVHIMKLLEIVYHPNTGNDVTATCERFAETIGKESILVKNTPGFATSRLGVAIGMEAIRMLEEGVASAEDIDKAMVLGYRHPIGPLKLTDMVGLDVRLAIGEYLAKELGNPAFEPPKLLRSLVEQGKLGKKSKEGFYRY
jgi:3-hydroxybutyryl-CoA dehydrogenase